MTAPVFHVAPDGRVVKAPRCGSPKAGWHVLGFQPQRETYVEAEAPPTDTATTSASEDVFFEEE